MPRLSNIGPFGPSAAPILPCGRYAALAREIGGLLNKRKDGQPRIELPLGGTHRAIDAGCDASAVHCRM